jgi:hypothetical protein
MKILDPKEELKNIKKEMLNNIISVINCDINFYDKLSEYILKYDEKRFNKFKDYKKGRFLVISIFSNLKPKYFSKFLGDGIYHNEFGEGVGRNGKLALCVSYFVEIQGVKLHINYDNRGSAIELPYNLIEDCQVKKIESVLKEYLRHVYDALYQ